jgi:DNA-binding SARP family transcriptional activator
LGPVGPLTQIRPVGSLTVVDFRLLGPLQVMVDGVPQPMAGVKPKAVLAVLLINRDRVVSSGAIAEAIWNDDAPAAYSASLQVFMSTLRRTLRVLSATGNGVVSTESPGYRLSVRSECVDLGRFERARQQGNEHFAAKRFVDASAFYRSALAEWTGPALADLRGFRFAEEFATAVEEERLSTLQARIDADLACGRDSAVIGELTTLVGQHPLREPLWAQLMTAYYRMGRQADALDASRRIRALLNDELGIDPSPALQELERKILRQESLWQPVVNGGPPVDMLQTQTEDDDMPTAGTLVLPSGQVVPIPLRGLRIGRMAENDLVLNDPKVSRYHAVIVDTGNGFAISDLRSTNGVSVGSTRVLDSRVLDIGDVIRIGATEMEFRLAP